MRWMIPPEDVVDVRAPPGQATGKVAELWKPVEGTNKIVCTACARYCKIGEGQGGRCGVRAARGGEPPCSGFPFKGGKRRCSRPPTIPSSRGQDGSVPPISRGRTRS